MAAAVDGGSDAAAAGSLAAREGSGGPADRAGEPEPEPEAKRGEAALPGFDDADAFVKVWGGGERGGCCALRVPACPARLGLWRPGGLRARGPRGMLGAVVPSSGAVGLPRSLCRKRTAAAVCVPAAPASVVSCLKYQNERWEPVVVILVSL